MKDDENHFQNTTWKEKKKSFEEGVQKRKLKTDP